MGKALLDLGPVRARLLEFLGHRIADPHLIEDIAQEALARLIEAHGRAQIADPTGLAVRIADNLLVDHFRRARRRPTEPLDDDQRNAEPSAEDVVDARQRLQGFYEALMRLPPLRREVFVRRRVYGESLDSIARDLGMSRSAAEKHVTRALIALAKSNATRD